MTNRRIRRFAKRTGFKDPERARIDAAQRGRDHGRRDLPSPPSLGGAVDDRVAEALVAEADTAAVLAIADHLAGQRPADDAAVARAAGDVLRRTAETADARGEYAEAVHRLAAVEAQSTRSWWDRPWPRWLRAGLILLMAAGSVANLAAGLVGVTADDPGYALGYSIAIGAGLVGLGAACGQMLKRWELNRLQPGEHVATRSRVPGAVVALGLAVAFALAVAVASIRATASEAEAQRLAEATSSAIELAPDATDPASGSASDLPTGGGGDGRSGDPAIPAGTWGVLEGVLVASALLVEYVGAGSGAQVLRDLRRAARRRRRAWLVHRKRLAHRWAALRAASTRRAAHDAAVIVAGEATLRHADREVAIYRSENLVNRPRAHLADLADVADVTDLATASADAWRHGVLRPPPRFPAGAAAELPTTDLVVARWGDDLLPFEADALAAAHAPAASVLPLTGAIPEILARAQAELEMVVVRPHLDRMSWDLGHLLQLDGRAPSDEAPAPAGTVVRPEIRPRTGRGGATTSDAEASRWTGIWWPPGTVRPRIEHPLNGDGPGDAGPDEPGRTS